MNDWHFDFVIHKIDEEFAQELLDKIIDFAEDLDTNIGGGFSPIDYAEVSKEMEKMNKGHIE
jgi:hypothetical protein